MSLGTAVYDLPGGDLLVRDQETGLSVIGSWHEVRRIGRSALEEMMRNRLQAEVANRASIALMREPTEVEDQTVTDRICNPHTHRWDGDWCYTCTAKHPGGRDAFDMALTAAVAECQNELSRTPTSASPWERVAIQSCIDRINALKRPSR